jgi:hypothetical protein
MKPTGSKEYLMTLSNPFRNTDALDTRQTATLIAGDAAAFLVFAVVGLASHGGLASDPLQNIVRVAAPFAAGWFAVAPFAGAFTESATFSPRRMLARTALTWLPACLVGVGLRALMSGQPWPPITFVVITFTTVLIILGGWRTAFAWALQRRQAPQL